MHVPTNPQKKTKTYKQKNIPKNTFNFHMQLTQKKKKVAATLEAVL